MSQRVRDVALLIAAGLFAGSLSGLFGIGGGTVIIPALMAVGYSQREASASSLLAIVPTCISGVISYASVGRIAWIPALLMTVGMLIGVQVGTWMLARLSEGVLRWGFVAFIVTLIVIQVVYVPAREGILTVTFAVGIALFLLGCLCGFLAGLLGIGGGAVAVPGLTLLGMSDLGARGVSMVVMLPGALSGTVTNYRRGLVCIGPALIVGCTAVCAVPFGAWCATLLSPRVDALLFGAWFAVLLVRSIVVARKVPRTGFEPATFRSGGERSIH